MDRRIRLAIPVLGAGQITAWGATYYLPAILVAPATADTGWSETSVIGAFSLALLVSGLAAPGAGRLIQRAGGRRVMVAGALVSAAGLVLMGLAPNVPAYAVAWMIVGLGMAGSLYPAAFATLSQIHGDSARRAITNLTLIGGLASTAAWPAGHALLQWLGWRELCFLYAALLVLLIAPLYWSVLPDRRTTVSADPGGDTQPGDNASGVVRQAAAGAIFRLLAAGLMLSAFISSSLSVYLIVLLTDAGTQAAEATAIAMLMGPAQVGARLIERQVAARHHPLWTLLASMVLLSCGVALLYAGFGWLAAGVIVYGAGNGLISIAKGTVPLAIYGAGNYPVLAGKLERPVLLTHAASPFVASLIMGVAGSTGFLACLLAVAVATVPLSLWLIKATLYR